MLTISFKPSVVSFCSVSLLCPLNPICGSRCQSNRSASAHSSPEEACFSRAAGAGRQRAHPPHPFRKPSWVQKNLPLHAKCSFLGDNKQPPVLLLQVPACLGCKSVAAPSHHQSDGDIPSLSPFLLVARQPRTQNIWQGG